MFGLALPTFAMAVPSTTIVYIAPTSTPMVSNEVLRTAPLSSSTVALIVRAAQEKYGLGDDFYETLKYESSGFQNIQSKVLNAAGPYGHEDSWGIPQINLPSHPEITRLQALDIRWAVDWAAQRFKKGYQHEWSAWRLLFGKKVSSQ